MNIPDKLDITPERFIQGYAKLLTAWGMPLTAARVFGWMMMQPQPVSLDEIAAGLGISKAGAWTAAKHLEQVNQIERFGEPGSKRARFAPMENFARALFNYSRLLSKSGALMREGSTIAAGPEAKERMLERADFFIAVHEAIEATMAELMAERRKAAE